MEIISNNFSDHNSMKLEINHRKRSKNKIITWRLNNMLLKNQWVNEEIRNTLEQMTMKTQPYKIYEMQQKQFLEGSS